MKTEVKRRSARTLLLGVVLGGALATSCSSASGALDLVEGPVTLTTTTPLASGDALSSGQTISITVASNSTLDQSSLATAGFPSGNASMKVLECDDPGGLKANLPQTEQYKCDGSTIASTTYVNADGSFKIASYTVYALPDLVTLGEPADSKPVCGTTADECVLYIGPNQTDFSKPHLFSSPFLVTASSNDKGAAVSGSSAPTGSNAAVALTPGAATSSTATTSGTLAYTGAPPLWWWMVGAGGVLLMAGAVARRLLGRLAEP
jgi:hypothetical protein